MEFSEFLRQKNRMCDEFSKTDHYCYDCALSSKNNGKNIRRGIYCEIYKRDTEDIVKKWVSEHPEEATNPSDNRTSEEKQAKTYGQGLEDAWELAIKIWCHIDTEELYKIFDTYEADEVMNGFTVQEVMQKLQEWEDKQIKVGDVLQFANHDKFVVVTSVDEHGMNYLCDNLVSYRSTGKEKDLFLKTGRNVADKLNTLLEDVKGE